MNKIIKLEDDLIERTALQFAAIFWEAGKSSGMPSKYKTARAYAKAYFERFIPKVVEHFLDILANPSFDADAKVMIWEALQKRHNDPNLQTQTQLPNIDVKKLIELTDKGKLRPNKANLKLIEDVIKSQPKTDDPFIKKFRTQ